ncbi:MAG: hypothetical protein ACI4M0_06025 [Christensenellales bacterium]
MKKFTACFLCFVILLSLCASTLAWFVPGGKFMPPITATAVAKYFAGGDGSQADPYILNAPIHVYNLAWLQNKGVFDQETHYFKIDADIDMLTGSEITGAVPPIGSTLHPFSGYFDGQGHTVSNLWVSSDPDDWAEKPSNAQEVDIGSDIGMFGSVVKRADGVTYVGNFYLQNVEVTTDVSECNVGIVAGNLDASMSLVGVVNAKITAKTGVEIHSDFSLVGKTSTGVNWSDAPSDIQGGGNLTVQPNNTADSTDPYYIYNAFNSSTGRLENSKQTVPGALEGSAYFYDTMTLNSVGGNGTAGVHFYNDATLTYSDRTISDLNFTSNSLPSDATQEESDFWDYYSAHAKTARFIKMGGTPNLASIMENGTSLDGLQNAVWFKPKTTGKCALSFVHTAQSTDNYMSLYRFKRVTVTSADGGTIETIEPGSLQEMQFILPKALNNKNVVFFLVTLGQEDLAYEYVIGLGSKQQSNNAGFFYMMLAGSDENSGTATEGTGRILEKIDFLPSVPAYGTDTSTVFTGMHLPVLAINTEENPTVTSAKQSFYYAVSTVDNLVHYYTDGVVPMTEVAKPSGGNYKETSADFFTPIRP